MYWAFNQADSNATYLCIKISKVSNNEAKSCIHILIVKHFKPASLFPTDQRVGESDVKSDVKSGNGRTCFG